MKSDRTDYRLRLLVRDREVAERDDENAYERRRKAIEATASSAQEYRDRLAELDEEFCT